ncbi:sigma-70 family RNA polymerase sigma factor [Paraburkholderia kururiensis]|uniref:sigma-70 family RNA polymerase sigma factor n=1 Tax=Paraburkholderia kururiensis TaxID=984307 RepID=UPI00034725CE|nr:sigma-70 family RNA polymerase sigma factor [Paraburkholderia kururiensis]
MTQSSSNNGITAFEALRARLESLAYRLLRSRAEAEDVVQDAWLKWHAADANALREPAAWLATITTRLAIDRLRRLRRERMPRAHGALPQTWPGDAGEAGDSGHSGHSGHAADWAPSAEDLALRAAEMSHGLSLLLERLSPVERAAFVLHEGFDCDYAEIARLVGKTPANCRQIVHRARERLQRPGMPSAPDDPARHRQVVDRLREAIALQDRAGVMALVGAGTAAAYEACDPAPLMERDEVSALAHASPRFGNALTWTQTRHSLLHAESEVAIEGEPRVALLDAEGEIVALIAVSVAASENAPIARMAIITDAAVLRAANRLYGARAVKRLLQRIFEQPVRGDAVRCGVEEAVAA